MANRKATKPPMNTATTNSGPITNQVRARRNSVERRHTRSERRCATRTASRPTTISSITRRNTGRNSSLPKGFRGTAPPTPLPSA